MSKEELISERDKCWDYNNPYKCPYCGSTNITHLTRSAWWNFYFVCQGCAKISEFAHGDHMGGGVDMIFPATMEDVKRDLNGKYSEEMKLLK